MDLAGSSTELGRGERAEPKCNSQAEGISSEAALCSLTPLLFCWHSARRLHSGTVAELTLGRGSQNPRKELAEPVSAPGAMTAP